MFPIHQSKDQHKPILPCETARGANLGQVNELKLMIELFQEIFPTSQCLLLLLNDSQTEKLCYVDREKETTQALISLCYQLIERNQSRIKQAKRIYWTKKDHRQAKIWEKLGEDAQINSLLIVPLFDQESYFGEICLAAEKFQEQWTKKQIHIVNCLAKQCISIFHKNRSLKELYKQLLHQKLVDTIHQKINSNLKPEIILRETLQAIGEIFEEEQVCLAYCDNIEITIQYEWRINDSTPPLINRKISISEWLTFLEVDQDRSEGNNQVKLLQKNVIKENFINLEMGAIEAGYLRSFPVFIQENFWGFLIIQSRVRKYYSLNSNTKNIEKIANLISIIIYYIQHQDRWIIQQIEKLKKEQNNLEASKQKNEQFLNHTVHELRSPLTGILSFARILQEQIYGPLNQKQSEYIDVIVSSGKHILSLINDFLDLAKIEASREEIILETMAVEDICLASVAMVKAEAEAVGIDLKLDIDGQVAFCKADKKRIKQILVNLLSNGIKFTEIGSVTLKVKLNQNYLEFSVIDTGIGIKPDDQKKLFQPFQQIKNRLSHKYKGTGLGLALSRRYAQLHGGDITLVSQENKGSCFTLYLPL
jgi:signal transduction histidine kinase